MAQNNEVKPQKTGVYFHTACGNPTKAGGGLYRRLCDPYAFAMVAPCSRCMENIGIDKLRWTDKRETMEETRKKARSRSPKLQFWFRFFIVPLIVGGLLGLLTMVFHKGKLETGPFLAGLGLGLFFGFFVAVPFARMIWPIDEYPGQPTK